MKFAWPDYALLFPILLIAGVLVWIYQRYQNRQLLNYFSTSNLEKLADRPSHHLPVLTFILWSFMWIFLVVSLMGPLLGERIREVKSKGTDIIIALDVSNSMLAQDIQPSRLEKTKLEIRNFVSQLKGDRVGLIVFENDAFLQCPLTTDYSAIYMYLDAITTGYLPNPGTNLAGPVYQSAEAFKRTLSIGETAEDKERTRILVVLSDGEDHEGGLNEAIAFAKEERIRVYTVGVGTAAGGPIPVTDRFGKVTDFRRDRSGNVVTTQLKEQNMAELASGTGGEYFRIGSAFSDFYKLSDVVSSLKKEDYKAEEVLDLDNKFQYPLAAGLVLFMCLTGLTLFTTRKKEPLS